jgi:hypothetical protein
MYFPGLTPNRFVFLPRSCALFYAHSRTLSFLKCAVKYSSASATVARAFVCRAFLPLPLPLPLPRPRPRPLNPLLTHSLTHSLSLSLSLSLGFKCLREAFKPIHIWHDCGLSLWFCISVLYKLKLKYQQRKKHCCFRYIRIFK